MEQSSLERETARLTPALYHLVPSFKDAIKKHPSQNIPDNFYSVETWQEGVIDTLAEFIRIHGLHKGNLKDRKDQAYNLLGEMLKLAKSHRKRLEDFRLEQANLNPTSWLCMVGVDAETRVQLQIDIKAGKPVFNLTSDDRKNNWVEKKEDPKQRELTGDGTVPFLGAEPSFLTRNNLVCLRPDDFGYWEIRDHLILGKAGFHALLPNLNLAQRLITSHFRGKAGKGIWARPAPGINKRQWNPPIKGLKLKE